MKPTKWILLTTLAALPLFSGNAHAQSGAPQAAPEDIVVTARRTEERLQDVPISISVFNQDQLAARNIVNSTDLATYTPSLAVNSRYGPEKAVFALRGFSQDPGTVPTVGVYFADVVAPRLVSNIASGNGAGPGSMFDLQDVQVLKGPQGTLFGKNTTGGAILLVPQRPTDKLGGYAEVSVGNYNMLRGQAVLNVPISDTFKIRLGIDRDKRDGYLINKSGIGPANFNDVNYLAARLGILANITPNLENYALVTYTRSHDHGTTGRAAFCSTAPSPFGPLVTAAACGPNGQIARDSTRGFYDVESSDPTSGEYIETWQAINTTTWKAADTLTVKNIASYGQSRESYSFNIIGDNLLIPTPSPNGTPLSYGTVATYPGPNGGQGDQWTATEELQLQGHSANNRLTWQTGGYMERSGPDKNQTQYAVVLGNCTDLYAFKCNVQPGGSIGIAHNDYYFHSYALYGQATYKLTEQFSVTGGIRNTWDSETERADNVRVSPSPTGPTAIACSRGGTPQLTPAPTPGAALLSNGACTRVFSASSSKPTWLIDVDYKPTRDMLLFVKWARGYRAGGVNEANVQTETWKPEKVNDYEVGLKGSVHGDIRGNYSLVGFWNNFTDQQVTVGIPACVRGPAQPNCTNPAFSSISGVQNLGKSRIRGVEFDGSVFLGNAVRFDVGYAYLDAKVIGSAPLICDNTRFNCGNVSILAPGTTLSFAPKNRITITGTYTLPLPPSIGTVSVGATFTHTDSQNNTFDDFASATAGRIPYNASISPPTNLLNLDLAWKQVAGKPVDVSVFVTNATNEKYWVSAGGGLALIGAEYIMPGEPRMIGARLRYRL